MESGAPSPAYSAGSVSDFSGLHGAAVVSWDLQGSCVTWTPGAAALFGVPEAAALGRPMRDLIPMDDPANVDACVRKTLEGATLPAITREYAGTDGRRHAFRSVCFPVRDREGAPMGGVALLEDVTPIAEGERAHAESEAVRRSLFELSMDGIFVLDDAGRLLDCNPAAAELLSTPNDALRRMRVADFASPGEALTKVWETLLREGSVQGIHRIVRGDGAPHALAYVARANVLPGRHLAIVRDMTDILTARRSFETSEARFQTLFHRLPHATFVLQARADDLVLLEWNAAAEALGGPHLRLERSVREALGTMPDSLDDVLDCVRDRRGAAREGTFVSAATGQAYALRIQHQFVPPDLVITTIEDVSAQRRAEAEHSALLDAEREARLAAQRAEAVSNGLTRRLATVTESERRRLARELHDEFGQELTALRVLLEASLTNDGSQPARVAEAERRVAGLQTQVREMSLSLHPQVLDDLGLAEAMAWSARRIEAATGLRVTLRRSAVDRRFPAAIELAAYRIAQEAMTNVIRHSRAASAEVRLWTLAGSLFVEVRDKGCGFDSEQPRDPGASLGIEGMRERAEALGGTLAVESAPHRGTVVTASFPLAEGGPP